MADDNLDPTASAALTTSGYDDITDDAEGYMTSQYTFEERVSIGVILSVIIFFSVAGNVLVCVAILTERSLRKTGNYFIVSLAIADMLVAVLVMTFAVANDIMGYWVFGGTFCNVWLSSDVMCSTASILNLCAISLDRYIHIRSPLHYERWVTRRRTLLAITFVWMLSALISFLPIHLGWHELGAGRLDADADVDRGADDYAGRDNVTTDVGGGGGGGGGRSADVGGNGSASGVVVVTVELAPPGDRVDYSCMLELNPLYAVFSSMVSFYIPCVVMILIYIKMYQYARMHVKNIRKSMAAGAVNHISNDACTGAPSTEQHPPANKHQYKMADHKAAITLGVIMGVFLFCWVPFFTINIIGAFCPACIPPVVFSGVTWLGYLNSALNPIIYSIFNTEFRDAFKRVLTFARCRGDYYQRRAAAYHYDKPIRCNGSSSYTVEYGTVNNTTGRKASQTKLMPDKITSV